MRFRVLITSVLVCCLLWGNPSAASATGTAIPFTDLGGTYAGKAVSYLAQQGMIRGNNTGLYNPGQPISRLDFAVLLARVCGVQPFFPGQPSFSDVQEGGLAEGYIEALAALGIIRGSEDKLFSPNLPMRRQDAALVLQRAMGEKPHFPGIRLRYKDAAGISPYAAEGVDYVTERGWMTGSGGRFNPRSYLTRGEAAVLAERLLKIRTEQAGQGLEQPSGAVDLSCGEGREIEVNTASYPLSFSVVAGSDNRAARINPIGSKLTAAGLPGTGILTINSGTLSYPVLVNTVRKENTERATLPTDGGSGEVNAILPASVRVVAHAPDEAFHQTEYKSYSGPVDGLTSNSDTWTGFFRQQGRDIVADLGGLKTVSTVSIEFRQDAGAGIYLPKYLEGFVSADGVVWYRLGKVCHQVNPGDKTVTAATFSLAFPPVATRYVQLRFPVDVFVFARHLSVGAATATAATSPVILPPRTEIARTEAGYLKDEDSTDILLVFTGDKTDIKTLDQDDFLPLIAYLGPGNVIRGRMFDTLLFVPYTGMPCTSSAWTAYLDDLFAGGQQLSALNEAVAEMNDVTGMNVKERVILTLPYPDSNQKEFGPIENGGAKLSFASEGGAVQATENRLAVLGWYYGELIRRWQQSGFSHLELAGIYWYKEAIDPTITGEEDLVRRVAAMVRADGHRFFWIPYFGAPGIKDWPSYGFTHVFLQPNYYATQAPSEDRMNKTAEMARYLGAGVEIELDNRALTARYYYDLFNRELALAHELGMDVSTPNAYYIGFARTLLDAAASDVPEIRKIYDDLYRWMSGTYE